MDSLKLLSIHSHSAVKLGVQGRRLSSDHHQTFTIFIRGNMGNVSWSLDASFNSFGRSNTDNFLYFPFPCPADCFCSHMRKGKSISLLLHHLVSPAGDRVY